MTHDTAKKQGLEPIFPECTEAGTLIFYDPKEGKYYHSGTDMFFDLPGNIRAFIKPELIKGK